MSWTETDSESWDISFKNKVQITLKVTNMAFTATFDILPNLQKCGIVSLIWTTRNVRCYKVYVFGSHSWEWRLSFQESMLPSHLPNAYRQIRASIMVGSSCLGNYCLKRIHIHRQPVKPCRGVKTFRLLVHVFVFHRNPPNLEIVLDI
jgi:hypothetical protein